LQFQTKLAIIDADEIDPLINAIKLMLTKEFITKKTEYTEVSFRSRSGFVTGAYFSPDKKNWEPFIQLNYLDSKSTVFVKVDDLKDLQDKLQKAKEQF
jgi:hypothetical protein